MVVQEGQLAPAFTLPDQDGSKLSLAELRGQHVVLYFYPRDATSGCTKEACGFRDLHKQLHKAGVVVLGVSPDGVESHAKFRAAQKLPFRLLADPERKVLSAYGAYGKKVMYGKPVVGVIRSTVWIGPDGKVRKHWKKVAKAADHPAQVLAAIQAAG
jgi:peroxiredoxin Q/BCP